MNLREILIRGKCLCAAIVAVPLTIASVYGEIPLEKPAREYYTMRGGLDNCHLRFEREKVGRVAFLGGSITEVGAWRELVCQELRRRFPNTRFDFINAGISSMGSTPGAFRLSRDVLRKGPVDLLFEEAAVNDECNGQTDLEQVRGWKASCVRRVWLIRRWISFFCTLSIRPRWR